MTRLATLVPAYKPAFLAPLFQSLRAQTFRDFKLIIADDSPGGAITKALREGRFDTELSGLDVLVVPGAGGGLRNHQRALDVWGGSTDLVHLLMDDDVLDPDFYASHAAVHAASPGVSASVSLRRLVDADGRQTGMLPLPRFVTDADDAVLFVDARTLVQTTVPSCFNWLGELSNMVLTAAAARCFPVPPATGHSYFGLPDIGLLLGAKRLGPVAAIRRVLGGFRQHAAQTTADFRSRSLKIAHLAWVAFALQARDEGHLDDHHARQAIGLALERCLHRYGDDADLHPFYELARLHDDLDRLALAFDEAWGTLIDANPDTARDTWPGSMGVGVLQR
jgi:hypothetical protein